MTEPTKKKIIYLDQNIWVELLKVYSSADKSSEFWELCNWVLVSSSKDEIIFPISFVNMVETTNRMNSESRHQLVDFIDKVSKGNTIQPYTKEFREEEMRHAILKRFNASEGGIHNKVFGSGIPHLMGASAIIGGEASELKKKTALRLINSRALLKWTLENHNRKDFGITGDPHLLKKLEAIRSEEKKIKDNSYRRKVSQAKFFCSLLPEIVKMSLDLGYTAHLFKNRPKDLSNVSPEEREIFHKEIIEFFQTIPATYVSSVLKYERNDAQRTIKDHDLNDIYSFAMAVPYCDIVVGENMFISFAKKAKLDNVYNTTLLKGGLKEFNAYYAKNIKNK